MKLSTLALFGIAGYFGYEYLKQHGTSVNPGSLLNVSPTGSGTTTSPILPSGAIFVQSIQAFGMNANIYMDSSGYYLALLGSSGQPVRVFGPYSQNQVYTALDIQKSFGNLLSGSG